MLDRANRLFPVLASISLCVLVLFLGFSIVSSSRAAPNQPVSVQAQVPTILKLVVPNPSMSFAFTESDYDETTGIASIEQSAATDLLVIANVPWQVSVSSSASNFTYTPPGGSSFSDPGKPVGDLAVKKSDVSSYTALTSSDQPIATGSPGGSGNPTNTINVDYRLQSSLANDPPGDYEISVTYTVTAQ